MLLRIDARLPGIDACVLSCSPAIPVFWFSDAALSELTVTESSCPSGLYVLPGPSLFRPAVQCSTSPSQHSESPCATSNHADVARKPQGYRA